MAWRKVVRYELGYSVATEKFYLYYELDSGTTVSQIFLTPEQFTGLSHLFESTTHVMYEDQHSYFVGGWHEPGAALPSDPNGHL